MRHYDLGRELVRRGHEVCLFTSGFSHNRFTYDVKFKPFSIVKKAEYEGVKYVFLRTNAYKGNNIFRVLSMFLYFIEATFYGIMKRGSPDVIIGSSVHPLAVVAAWLVARIRGAHFVFEVRDLWPETLIDMGALKRDSLTARILRTGEKFLYQKASAIIILLPYAHEYIESLGVEKNKITWIPNGTQIQRYAHVAPMPLKNNPPFTIMYLGALGRVNGLDILIRGFKILEEKYPGQFFLEIYGFGPEKKDLLALVERLEVHSVSFHDPVSKNKLHEVMGKADAFIYVALDLPLYKYGISLNKLNDYLSAGRPVISIANTRNNVVEESKCGVVMREISPESVAHATEQLFFHHTAQERQEMGANGKNYVKEHFDISKLALRLEDVLLRL
ncbi:MAG: glycosyltransferase family 4 protein [Flavobacteriales bacterium]|nr:glycosyltransferase family 4 protein [Flavobacteriales bacterium]